MYLNHETNNAPEDRIIRGWLCFIRNEIHEVLKFLESMSKRSKLLESSCRQRRGLRSREQLLNVIKGLEKG